MLTIEGVGVLAIAAMIVSFVWPELSPWFKRSEFKDFWRD
jgi:hypothetical protein